MNTLSTLESKSDVVKGLRTRDSGVDSDFSNSKSPEYEKKNDLAAKLKRLVQKRDNLKKRLENESKRKVSRQFLKSTVMNVSTYKVSRQLLKSTVMIVSDYKVS